MKKFSPKEILIPTVVLLVICIVSSALLAGTNMLTKDRIATINEQTKSAAMQEVMPDAKSFDNAVTVSETLEYATAKSAEGKAVGYAFTVSENGYGGEIKLMVGVKLDGTVSSVKVLAADSETPGLGANVKNDSFLSQFTDKNSELTVVKNAPSDNEIQAITSATISSTAVTKAINNVIAYYNNNLGGANNG